MKLPVKKTIMVRGLCELGN